MLSTFESALLDRHLRGCASCQAFANAADEQTRLLRAAALEQPTRRVVVEAETGRTLPARAAGVLSACLVAAVAAVIAWPGSSTSRTAQSAHSPRVGAPVPVVVPSVPAPGVNLIVPRLRMQPASIADGPVHGYFSTPVTPA